MARQIASQGAAAPDEYVQKLYKLIPAEISAAYIAASSIINPTQPSDDIYLLYAFIVLLVALPFYMWIAQSVRNWVQILFTVISFPIWAANVSSIQLVEDMHKLGHPIQPVALGVTLILWTVLTPLFVK